MSQSTNPFSQYPLSDREGPASAAAAGGAGFASDTTGDGGYYSAAPGGSGAFVLGTQTQPKSIFIYGSSSMSRDLSFAILRQNSNRILLRISGTQNHLGSSLEGLEEGLKIGFVTVDFLTVDSLSKLVFSSVRVFFSTQDDRIIPIFQPFMRNGRDKKEVDNGDKKLLEDHKAIIEEINEAFSLILSSRRPGKGIRRYATLITCLSRFSNFKPFAADTFSDGLSKIIERVKGSEEKKKDIIFLYDEKLNSGSFAHEPSEAKSEDSLLIVYANVISELNKKSEDELMIICREFLEDYMRHDSVLTGQKAPKSARFAAGY